MIVMATALKRGFQQVSAIQQIGNNTKIVNKKQCKLCDFPLVYACGQDIHNLMKYKCITNILAPVMTSKCNILYCKVCYGIRRYLQQHIQIPKSKNTKIQ